MIVTQSQKHGITFVVVPGRSAGSVKRQHDTSSAHDGVGDVAPSPESSIALVSASGSDTSNPAFMWAPTSTLYVAAANNKEVHLYPSHHSVYLSLDPNRTDSLIRKPRRVFR
jgi:hypothetical protein